MERADAARRDERPPRACGRAAGLRLLAAALTVAVIAGVCAADKITKIDGTILTGTIVKEDERTVTLEMVRYGAKMVLTLQRKQIMEILRRKEAPATLPTTRPAPPEPTGPTYYPLPLIGEIGVEVSADALRRALNDARSQKPDYVVLYFDSYGGSAEGMKTVVQELAKYKSLRMIALVRRALGAAAVVAMTSRDIYMTPDGIIGSAMMLSIGPDGKPDAGDPQVRSALRAFCRSAAQRGGHSDLLLRGMMEMDLRLVIRRQDGRPVVSERGEGKLLKTEGRLLTMVATEAVAAGLAKGIAEKPEDLHSLLGLDEWRQARGGGWLLMKRLGKENRLRAAQAAYRARKEAYMKQIAEQLAAIDRALDAIGAKGRVAQAKKKDLAGLQKAEGKMVRSEYWLERREADAVEAGNPELAARMRARARENYDFKRMEIRRRYQLQYTRVDTDIAELAEEVKRLLAERKKLLAGVPKYRPPKPTTP